MRIRILFLPVVCLAALGLAACGGDDGATTTDTGGAATTDTGGASGAAVESAIEALPLFSSTPLTVNCPAEVPLEQGDEFDCDFTIDAGFGSGKQPGTMTVTVDSAGDTSAEVSFKGKADGTSIRHEQVKVQK
jgi:hypothetical protein